jgi:hypothetical protein
MIRVYTNIPAWDQSPINMTRELTPELRPALPWASGDVEKLAKAAWDDFDPDTMAAELVGDKLKLWEVD